MIKTKILFLLKKNNEYGHEYHDGIRSGLYNSVSMLQIELQKHFKNFEIKVSICVDGNSVDKEVHDYKPNVCILEAIWVTPDKLTEVQRLHPDVLFIVRLHSDIPFLSNEGIAVDWIRKFAKIKNTLVAFNCINALDQFRGALGIDGIYLPNLYDESSILPYRCHHGHFMPRGDTLNIGCFGAIRPLKNQFIQAMIAMEFANIYKFRLQFHINGTRVEQWGENVLKNIRALFENTNHKLVEWPWLERKEFLEVISEMNLGMQLSHNESFNIVSADFVSQKVPIIVSETIYWMPDKLKVKNYNVQEAISKLNYCLKNKEKVARNQIESILKYNYNSLKAWKNL